MKTAAQIYECEIMHQRLKPLQKPFTYRVFMLDVDIDELPQIAHHIHGLSHNRWNLFSINDVDHLHLGSGNIRSNLAEWLARQGCTLPESAKIRLITFPRVLGYGFNPVSFYYVNSSNGSPLFAIAEVVNTFREMKLYLIDSLGTHGEWRRRISKNFYVSPFSDPGDSFDFRLGIPSDNWQVNINDHQLDETVLVSSIHGSAHPLTSLRLLGYAFKYPLLSIKIIGLIHWHALLLWIRKVPYFRKTERLEAQQDVLRPHKSLSHSSTSQS